MHRAGRRAAGAPAASQEQPGFLPSPPPPLLLDDVLAAGGVSETREYRLRCLDKDNEVGEWSDVITVQTIP